LRIVFSILLAAALMFAAPATARPGSDELRLVDLTGEFATTWDRTADLPDAERVTAFKAHFAPILPGFYSSEAFGRTPARYDTRLLAQLKAYPQRRTEIADVSRRFDAMFQPALASFEARFGSMRGYPPVYIVHSLGEFDGGTRELPGGSVLLFGADMIAKLHATGDIRPFFHHELFHLYHARYFPECDAVWCSLWAEGLAVYVAKDLNPRSTDDELLLTQPEAIRPAVERNRTAAICAVVSRLDSKDAETQSALFSSGRLNPDLPPRFGYYVGYLAAAEMGRGRSLKQLAQMPPPEVRGRLERALRGLADCPS